MIKRIIGIVATLASLAVIVFAILHHGSYTSMVGTGKGDAPRSEQPATAPAAAPELQPDSLR